MIICVQFIEELQAYLQILKNSHVRATIANIQTPKRKLFLSRGSSQQAVWTSLQRCALRWCI